MPITFYKLLRISEILYQTKDVPQTHVNGESQSDISMMLQLLPLSVNYMIRAIVTTATPDKMHLYVILIPYMICMQYSTIVIHVKRFMMNK